MQERINEPDRFLISTRENGEKREHDIEVSEKEKRTFKILDKFGEIGRKLLSQFYDDYLPNTLTTDSLDGKFEINPKLNELEKLTPKQRTFLLSVIEQLKEDHIEMMRSLRGLSKEDVLQQLHADLFVESDKHGFDSKKVSVSVVPSGIGLLVHDRAYFNQKFPDSESVLGFYRRGEDYGHSANFPGRIFVIDTTNPEAIATFRHEYLHLLTDNYIEPYEISLKLPDEAVPIQKEINQLQERITELNEEMDYVDYDEVLAIQQEIGNIQKQIAELQRRTSGIIDESERYLTDEAQHLFNNVRDELSAWAVSGKFNTREDTLVSRNTTWLLRVGQIKHVIDRKKFVDQWEKLKLAISFCAKQKLAPDEVLPIFLTSQTFEQMTKRLLLFTQERQDETSSQQAA